MTKVKLLRSKLTSHPAENYFSPRQAPENQTLQYGLNYHLVSKKKESAIGELSVKKNHINTEVLI